MEQSLEAVLASYDAAAPLAEASTIPGSWYTDPRIAELERLTVFSRSWQVAGRLDRVSSPGQYLTTAVAGEPVLVARGADGILRAFFNVCRHHATAVAWDASGQASQFRCPYHGWTYGLDGALKGVTEFEGVSNFDRARNGLVPIRVETWEKFVFVNLDPDAPALADFLAGLAPRVEPLGLGGLRFAERRTYALKCNWKVFVDNYLDGGYHVPHMHKGLASVLEYARYTIENDVRSSIQSSPVRPAEDADAAAAATRKGDRAYYFWLYPNFMLNWYEGYLDTNLLLPTSVDQCSVIFDFYFSDTSESRRAYIQESISVCDRVQAEDTALCESVERGLKSRAYNRGRLSVRREAGEHLFHRLLAQDLRSGAKPPGA